MDKIMIGNADLQFLLEWRDQHKDLVRLGVCPIRSVKLEFYDSRYIITAIRDGENLTFRISQNGVSIGKLIFRITDKGLCYLTKNTTKLSPEDRQSVLTVYCSAMAFIVFGRDTVDIPPAEIKSHTSYKPIVKPSAVKKTNKKTKRKGIVYILSRSGNKPRFTVKGLHNKPNGIFNVRGHYRHYSSGKVIWISEYTKGTGKKKNKSYKIGSDGKF